MNDEWYWNYYVHYATSDYLGVKEEDSILEPEQQTEPVKAEENEDKENKENNKNYQKKNAKKEGVGKSQKPSITEDRDGVSVKGLSNLGNTCFFNAVIQVGLDLTGC